MAKLTRYEQKVFGSSAGTNEMSEFGGLFSTYPVIPTRYSGSTITPALVQALGNYLTGWTGAAIGGNSPAIEDMNALCYLFAYQLTYLMQEGVAEWDADTTYYVGSLVNDGNGQIYKSLTNTNLNNALTVEASWLLVTDGVFATSAATRTTKTYQKLNKVSATHTETLPTAVGIEGQSLKFWKTDSDATTVTFNTTSSQTMSGVASGGVTLVDQYSWVEFTSDGANWLVRNG